MPKLSVLLENRLSHNRALKCAHGLSVLVEHSGRRVLFDTGPDSTFLYNAHRLGVSLSDIDAVVLSHGHYDHASGFMDYMEAGYSVSELYVGKGFFDRKYSENGNVLSDLSVPWKACDAAGKGCSIIDVAETVEIFPDFFILSSFPRIHDEIIPARYVVERDGKIESDDFSDEIAIAVRTDEGVVLIAGCSHPGIMNMADEAEKRVGPLKAVVGGVHLVSETEERTERTISYLQSKGVSSLYLCHCSGRSAEEHSTHVGCGDVIIFR